MPRLGVLFLLAAQYIFNTNGYKTETLQMVYVLFRHGHRANDAIASYPKDLHKNFDYAPFGWGQLTNKGKMREYDLGQILYERYCDFLGPYTPGVIEALSTNTNRTKMSLELVLAGLFPPEGPLAWNRRLNWQPIPYNYLTSTDNRMGFPTKCAKRFYLIAKHEESPEVQTKLRPYKKWFDYINKHTGLDVKCFADLFLLYFGLSIEEEWGLNLPDWVKPIYPNLLREATIENYRIWSGTPEITKLGGFNLKTIIDAAKQKINGTTNPPEQKIMLFSGHELNIAGMLNSLKLYYRHIPPYGSCIIFELHKIGNQYGFKLFYETHNGRPSEELCIPGCHHFCPIDRFVELLRENIPENYDICENESYSSVNFFG